MIELFDDYVISVDPYNYTFAKRITKKDKDGVDRESYKSLSYCSTLSGALNSARLYFIRQGLSTAHMSLSEALATIRDVNDQMEKFIRENVRDI